MLREWIISVLVSGLVSAVLLAIVPEGTGKKILGMACGVFVTLAVISPAASAVMKTDSVYGYVESAIEKARREIESNNEINAQLIITANLNAYIENKAHQLGISCRCETQTAQNSYGVLYPYSIAVTYKAPADAEKRAALTELIEKEYAIPRSRQKHTGEE